MSIEVAKEGQDQCIELYSKKFKVEVRSGGYCTLNGKRISGSTEEYITRLLAMLEYGRHELEETDDEKIVWCRTVEGILNGDG